MIEPFFIEIYLSSRKTYQKKRDIETLSNLRQSKILQAIIPFVASSSVGPHRIGYRRKQQTLSQAANGVQCVFEHNNAADAADRRLLRW